MKRSRKILFAAISAVAVVAAMAVILSPRHNAAPSSGGAMNIGSWTQVPGSTSSKWKQTKGGLSVTAGVGNRLLSDTQYDDSFTASVTVTITGETGSEDLSNVGLVFRATGIESGEDSFDGYYLGIDSSEGMVFLDKQSSGSWGWEEVATKRMAIEQDTPYRLTVDVSGDHFVAYINKTDDSWPVIDVIDEDFAVGEIGLLANELDATFSDFSVDSFTPETSSGATYTNSVLPNVADPDVLYWNGTYYMYPTTTNANVGGIKVYTSTDLANWTDKGLAMTAGPDNFGTKGFWAPDVIERDGRFYMYYTANEEIAVSVSDSPLGPFKQVEFGPMHPERREIDANVFRDEDGQYYIYFVRFNDGNVIYGAKLNDDMISIDEDTVVELLRPSQPWELDMGYINEAPYMVAHDGKYYLTYSGSHFESPMYGVGYAVSDSPLGPFEKYEQNPIMQSNAAAHGTGHHAVTTSPDGTELWMVYHRHKSLTMSDPRVLAIDRVRFTEDATGETVMEVYGPTVTEQPVPSGASDTDNLIEFDPTELAALSDGISAAAELPSLITIHTSKSDPDSPVQATIMWSIDTQGDGSGPQVAVGTVQLPEGVTNTGEVNLDLTARIKGQ